MLRHVAVLLWPKTTSAWGRCPCSGYELSPDGCCANELQVPRNVRPGAEAPCSDKTGVRVLSPPVFCVATYSLVLTGSPVQAHMLTEYMLVKFLHILIAILALGTSAGLGIVLEFYGDHPTHGAFLLRAIKRVLTFFVIPGTC